MHNRLSASLLAGLLALGSTDLASAKDEETTRVEIMKAAFIYNFARFATWPGGGIPSSADLTICATTTSPMSKSLASIHGKPLDTNSTVYVHFLENHLAPIEKCDVIYLSKGELDPTQMDRYTKNHILTVSDMEGFVDQGGMIGLIQVGRKLRFEINLDAAKRAQLRFSSQLIQLSVNHR